MPEMLVLESCWKNTANENCKLRTVLNEWLLFEIIEWAEWDEKQTLQVYIQLYLGWDRVTKDWCFLQKIECRQCAVKNLHSFVRIALDSYCHVLFLLGRNNNPFFCSFKPVANMRRMR